MAMGDLAREDEYLPDVGDPLIPSGPQFSPGVPAVNAFMGRLLAPQLRDENSPVQYTTASPLVNITGQDIKDATDAAMGFSGGGLGIKAYHSSPHDFDKFDLSKIGTGEGAQVYGHGLYFAENPAVSGQGGQYWKAFAGRFRNNDAEQMATMALKNNGVDRGKAIEWLRNGMWQENYPKQWDEAIKLLQSDKPVGPRTYEVNINADPAHMLDWDKPLREQEAAKRMPELLDAASISASNKANYRMADNPELASGELAYRGMVDRHLGAAPWAHASQQLREAGIPGIKYLDEGSRLSGDWHLTPPDQTVSGKWMVKNRDYNSKGLHFDTEEAARAALAEKLAQRTSNYVIFDPAKIDILKKYGLAGATAGTMGALASQDEYSQ